MCLFCIRPLKSQKGISLDQVDKHLTLQNSDERFLDFHTMNTNTERAD